ncbi:MAG: hypothetical protein ACLFNZ_01070 [Spirochaetaceae bacterium]
MSDPELVHVLYSDYGLAHFLINRDQCPASVYAEETVPVDSGYSYFEDRFILDGEVLPLFNLHRYLITLFPFKTLAEAQLVILTPFELLSEETVLRLRKGPLAGMENMENCRRIGVRISSETIIKQISLAELEPHPRVLRERLKKGGFPAAHPTEGSMGYFIDLDKILANTAHPQHEKTGEKR